MSPIIALSAIELADRIRTRQITPAEVVDAHIARIEATATLNAVVTQTFAQARQEAHHATEEVERGTIRGPLHGVPFTVKDSFDVAGVRSTCGLVSRANNIPHTSSPLVTRLQNAGGILLGKTNTPDNCGDYETNNPVFGLTTNAWDATRSAGGSTGGEAAIIAAGGSPLGIGSDIAGSIRLPSAFNGIVGLRPTSGSLPIEGFWPPTYGSLHEMNALGPMARRVEDIALAWDVLNERTPQPLTQANIEALRGVPVAYWYDDGVIPSSSAVKGGVQAAVMALRQIGMQPIATAPSRRQFASFGWTTYLGAEGREAWARGMGNGKRWSPAAEVARCLTGKQRVSTGTLVLWAVISYGPLLIRGIDAHKWRAALQNQIRDVIGENGVAVCPVFPTTAPRHGWSPKFSVFIASYTTWVNLAGLPGLVVPVLRSRTGLPVGVQIVGNAGSERTLLAAGVAIQQALMPTWNGPS